MKFHIITRGRDHFQIPITDGFSFALQMMAIKAAGHYQGDDFFIPYEAIDVAYVGPPDQIPAVAGMTRQ